MVAPPSGHASPIDLALVENARDGKCEPVQLGWDDLALLLTEAAPVKCVRGCAGGVHKADKLTLRGWVPALMMNDHRCAASVEALTCAVFDLDAAEPLDRVPALIGGHRGAAYTSWSHRAGHPKARVVMPFDAPVPVDRWTQVWRACARMAAAHGLTVDPACKDPSRLYFLPAVPANDAAVRRGFVADLQDGPCLSWRAVLGQYPEPETLRTFQPVLPAGQRRMPGQGVDETGRATFARAVLATRCRELAGTVQGSRNLRCFRAAAAAAQLAQHSGLMSLAFAEGEILAAALSAGLSQREALTTIQSGFQRGRADGPWPF